MIKLNKTFMSNVILTGNSVTKAHSTLLGGTVYQVSNYIVDECENIYSCIHGMVQVNTSPIITNWLEAGIITASTELVDRGGVVTEEVNYINQLCKVQLPWSLVGPMGAQNLILYTHSRTGQIFAKNKVGFRDENGFVTNGFKSLGGDSILSMTDPIASELVEIQWTLAKTTDLKNMTGYYTQKSDLSILDKQNLGLPSFKQLVENKGALSTVKAIQLESRVGLEMTGRKEVMKDFSVAILRSKPMDKGIEICPYTGASLETNMSDGALFIERTVYCDINNFDPSNKYQVQTAQVRASGIVLKGQGVPANKGYMEGIIKHHVNCGLEVTYLNGATSSDCDVLCDEDTAKLILPSAERTLSMGIMKYCKPMPANTNKQFLSSIITKGLVNNTITSPVEFLSTLVLGPNAKELERIALATLEASEPKLYKNTDRKGNIKPKYSVDSLKEAGLIGQVPPIAESVVKNTLNAAANKISKLAAIELVGSEYNNRLTSIGDYSRFIANTGVMKSNVKVNVDGVEVDAIEYVDGYVGMKEFDLEEEVLKDLEELQTQCDATDDDINSKEMSRLKRAEKSVLAKIGRLRKLQSQTTVCVMERSPNYSFVEPRVGVRLSIREVTSRVNNSELSIKNKVSTVKMFESVCSGQVVIAGSYWFKANSQGSDFDTDNFVVVYNKELVKVFKTNEDLMIDVSKITPAQKKELAILEGGVTNIVTKTGKVSQRNVFGDIESKVNLATKVSYDFTKDMDLLRYYNVAATQNSVGTVTNACMNISFAVQLALGENNFEPLENIITENFGPKPMLEENDYQSRYKNKVFMSEYEIYKIKNEMRTVKRTHENILKVGIDLIAAITLTAMLNLDAEKTGVKGKVFFTCRSVTFSDIKPTKVVGTINESNVLSKKLESIAPEIKQSAWNRETGKDELEDKFINCSYDETTYKVKVIYVQSYLGMISQKLIDMFNNNIIPQFNLKLRGGDVVESNGDKVSYEALSYSPEMTEKLHSVLSFMTKAGKNDDYTARGIRNSLRVFIDQYGVIAREKGMAMSKAYEYAAQNYSSKEELEAVLEKVSRPAEDKLSNLSNETIRTLNRINIGDVKTARDFRGKLILAVAAMGGKTGINATSVNKGAFNLAPNYAYYALTGKDKGIGYADLLNNPGYDVGTTHDIKNGFNEEGLVISEKFTGQIEIVENSKVRGEYDLFFDEEVDNDIFTAFVVSSGTLSSDVKNITKQSVMRLRNNGTIEISNTLDKNINLNTPVLFTGDKEVYNGVVNGSKNCFFEIVSHYNTIIKTPLNTGKDSLEKSEHFNFSGVEGMVFVVRAKNELTVNGKKLNRHAK